MINRVRLLTQTSWVPTGTRFFFSISLVTLDIRSPPWYTHHEGISLHWLSLFLWAHVLVFFCQLLTITQLFGILIMRMIPLFILNFSFSEMVLAHRFFFVVHSCGTLDNPKPPWYTNHSQTNGHAPFVFFSQNFTYSNLFPSNLDKYFKAWYTKIRKNPNPNLHRRKCVYEPVKFKHH